MDDPILGPKMDQPGDSDEGLGFDLLAASIRADAADLRTFMDALAVKLETAMPGAVWVEREGGLFKKEHPARRIRIRLEDRLFELRRAGAGLEARFLHEVQGITLKNEVVHLESWINELSHHLARHAQTSAEARAALEKLVT
jgi:hypothetical protein